MLLKRHQDRIAVLLLQWKKQIHTNVFAFNLIDVLAAILTLLQSDPLNFTNFPEPLIGTASVRIPAAGLAAS
jgi:hypothetical protein